MGQKTDARIFRQGVNNKNWKLKYIDKNNEDSSLFLYKTLEIKKYLDRFFEVYKMKVHNCKIFYSDSSLHVFVSFYLTTKIIYIINKNLTKYSKKLSTRTKLPFFKESKKKRLRFKPPTRKIKLTIKLFQKIKDKKNLIFNKLNPPLNAYLEEFQEILLESLIIYTKNKLDISVTLQNLNHCKQLSHVQIKDLKIVFKQLRKFIRKPFFKEAINILFVTVSKRESAKLLASFISNQLRLNQLKTDQMTVSRKDNYFFGFLKQILLLFIKSDISCLTGVKIVIKGRFNKAPRAKTIKIHFGKFSLQSFNSKINYYQSTAYTANGTFGVKVWLSENSF